MSRPGAAAYLNPYLAGIGLGLVLLATFVIMGRGLGAVPEGIEAAIDLHLLAMKEWLEDLEAKASGGTAGE